MNINHIDMIWCFPLHEATGVCLSIDFTHGFSTMVTLKRSSLFFLFFCFFFLVMLLRLKVI